MSAGTSVSAPFGRVMTAMVTPFTDDGSLDVDAALAVVSHLLDSGHDGIVVNGTTGESPTTTDAEKAVLVREVVAAVGDRAIVIAGAGTNDTAHTVSLCQQAAASGAHGLLLVTPYYSKPSQDGVLAHFNAAADATDLPCMLYDIPGRSATAIATETLLRLAEHPRIVAVKDAKADLFASADVMARTALAYYSGDDGLNLVHLANGAVGVVSVVGHVAGRQHAALVAAVDDGDLDRARDIARGLIPAVRGIMTRGQGAVMAKAALELTGVLPGRAVRLPLLAATPEQVELLRADLADAALLETESP